MSAAPLIAAAGATAATAFEPHRRRLTGLAYRMLGSLADAQDVVQEAWLRWSAADRAEVRDAGAYLARTVTRLSLDHLRSARARRETYIGPWLPEPVIDEASLGVTEDNDAALDVSVALMLALERLSPLERAAFLLHDVFDASFEEVASAINRTPEACRQLAARARRHVRDARPRFAVPPDEGSRIAKAFHDATISGDATALSRLLAESVVLTSDGGGHALTARNPIRGRDKVVRFVLQGQAAGPAIHGLIPGSMPGYDTGKVHGYAFDLAKARALMAEAGYPDGKGFPAVTLQLNSGGGRNELVAQAVQDMISKGLGVNIQIKVLEWPQHQELLETGKAPLFRLGWSADYPDADSFLNLFYSKTLPANPADRSPVNSTRYANPQFDALFEQALATNDDAQRIALYEQAEQIAVNDAPMLFIYHDLDYRMVQPYVRGYTSNAMDRRVFKYAWFDLSKKPA